MVVTCATLDLRSARLLMLSISAQPGVGVGGVARKEERTARSTRCPSSATLATQALNVDSEASRLLRAPRCGRNNFENQFDSIPSAKGLLDRQTRHVFASAWN